MSSGRSLLTDNSTNAPFMMLYTLTTLTLALVGAVRAKPLDDISDLGHPFANPADLFGSFPIVDLGSVAATPDVTLGGTGVHGVDAAAELAGYPTTLLWCESDICTNCTAFYVDVLPHETCLRTNIVASSVTIIQESGAGLPYSVSISLPPDCAGPVPIPEVNICYSISGGEYDSIVLGP